MTKLLTKDTTIRIGDTTTKTTEKSAGKVIECNVNMSVSLSNEKRSKIFQKMQSLLIIFFSITFCIFHLQVKYKVQELENQVTNLSYYYF